MALAAPVAARAADPLILNAPTVELHRSIEQADQIAQLGNGFAVANLVNDLVGDGHQRAARVVGQRRFGHQDQVLAVAQSIDDLRRGLAARKFSEVLLDVLNLPGAGFEGVLLDEVLHQTLDYMRRGTREVSQRGRHSRLARDAHRSVAGATRVGRGARWRPTARPIARAGAVPATSATAPTRNARSWFETQR